MASAEGRAGKPLPSNDDAAQHARAVAGLITELMEAISNRHDGEDHESQYVEPDVDEILAVYCATCGVREAVFTAIRREED